MSLGEVLGNGIRKVALEISNIKTYKTRALKRQKPQIRFVNHEVYKPLLLRMSSNQGTQATVNHT